MVDEAVKVLDLLRRLGGKGMSAAQLASAGAYLEGLYPSQQMETSDQLVDILQGVAIYGLNQP